MNHIAPDLDRLLTELGDLAFWLFVIGFLGLLTVGIALTIVEVIRWVLRHIGMLKAPCYEHGIIACNPRLTTVVLFGMVVARLIIEVIRVKTGAVPFGSPSPIYLTGCLAVAKNSIAIDSILAVAAGFTPASQQRIGVAVASMAAVYVFLPVVIGR